MTSWLLWGGSILIVALLGISVWAVLPVVRDELRRGRS